MKVKYHRKFSIGLLRNGVSPPQDAPERALSAGSDGEEHLTEEAVVEHALFFAWAVRLKRSKKIISRATLVVHPTDLPQEGLAGEICDITTLKGKRYQEIDPADWILHEIISSAQINNLLYIRVFIRPNQVEIRKLCKKFCFVRVNEPTGSEHVEEQCYQLDLES